MAKEKLPAIHLYPGDWLRDSVSGCSLAAQGLWLRMMFVAHDAANYGEMFACDLLASKASIARRCGCTLDEFESLFDELKVANVPGIEDGIVYSRRMMRDASLREERAKAGRKGGKQTAKQTRSKLAANRQAKHKQNTENESESEDANVVDFFDEWWGVVHAKIGREVARVAYAKAVAKLRSRPDCPDPHAFLLDKMRAFAASPSAKPPDRTPIHPTTWLNQGRYDDDPATWNHTPKGSSNGRRNDIGPGQRHDPATATRPPSTGWSD